LVRDSTLRLTVWLPFAALLISGVVFGQTMYKYRGDDGEWIYSDRPPEDGQQPEVRALQGGMVAPDLTVNHSFTGESVEFRASNRYYAPVEVGLDFEVLEGVEYPHPDDRLRWVVPPRSDLILLDLPLRGTVDVPNARYRYWYLPGDPSIQADDVVYGVPYAAGTHHTVTQAYPELTTHATLDSRYAVDIAMPVGTDVVAARDGIVFDVSSTNFKGGPDAQQFADLANVVRILHDDGTFAVYAHLNWNSIRVRPGDRVTAGEYIADSGNTGFSSGPHLHFAVLRNFGMRVESLPVAFSGADGSPITPATNTELAAYVP